MCSCHLTSLLDPPSDKTSHNVRTSSLDPAGEAPPVDLEPRLHLDAPPQTGNQQNLTVVSTAPQPNSEAPQVQSSRCPPLWSFCGGPGSELKKGSKILNRVHLRPISIQRNFIYLQ